MPKPTGAGFVFELLDIDGDGHITQTEYNKGFDILDKDQNGFLTRSEFGIASKLFFDPSLNSVPCTISPGKKRYNIKCHKNQAKGAKTP